MDLSRFNPKMLDTQETGSVLGWGRNNDGETGAIERSREGPVSSHYIPTLVQAFESKGIVQVACGERFTFALDENGNVYSWGAGSQGQLGHGKETKTVSKPELLDGELGKRRVVMVQAAQLHSAAVTDQGELFEWGLIPYVPEDQSGASTEVHGLTSQNNTSRLNTNSRLRELVRASEMRYLTSAPEDESSTGDHEDIKGEEGVVNLRTHRHIVAVPQLCSSLERHFVTRVALGASHVLVLTRDGIVFTRGYNDRGQLGTSDRISRADFQQVKGQINNYKVTDVVCGSAHSIVLDIHGNVWSFGSNSLGQLGLGPGSGEKLIPTCIDLLQEENVVQIASGDHFSACLTDRGEILSWGHSEYGQHGGGRAGTDLRFVSMTRHFHSPRRVPPFSLFQGDLDASEDSRFVKVVSIVCSSRASFAVDTLGRLWSWGCNGNGILGHGPGALWTNPRCIEDVPNVIRVAAGPKHVMAIVRQTGCQFALSYSSLVPSKEDSKQDFDLILRSRPSASQKDKDDPSLSVPGHKFLLFARCPTLKTWYHKAQGEQEKDEIRLPFILAPRVLSALIEYLYCDHIRSCPPHRLVDLQRLGKELNLHHLVQSCVFGRYQRDFKLVVNDSRELKAAPEAPRSTFTRDMLRAYKQTCYHDVVLTASDADEESNDVPQSHTRFSWTSKLENAPGHTLFSQMEQNVVQSANKKVLCRYQFFDLLLNGGFKESTQECVLLHNLTPKGLAILIRWMYSGDREAVLDPSTVMSVLASALCFGIGDLAQVCEKYIYDHVDPTNAQDVVDFAKDVGSARLAYRATAMLPHLMQ